MVIDQKRILSTVDDYREELVRVTSDLIRFKTVRLTGEDFEAAADYMAKRLKDSGLEVEVIKVPEEEVAPLAVETSHYRALGLKGPIAPRFNVIASRRGTRRSPALHLNGHYCVTEVGGGWSGDPFEPRVQDGRIIGKGACDMKSGLAMIVGALVALDRARVTLSGDLYVSVTVDTHLAGDLGAGYVARHRLGHADMVIIGDTSGVDRLLTGYRGQLWVEIETRGRPTHGSTPFYGRNAIEDMTEILEKIMDLRKRFERVRSQADIVPEGSRHPTITVTQINGGNKLNAVASSCRATLDRRLIPEETPEQALEEIRGAVAQAAAALQGIEATVRPIYSAPPAVTEKNDLLVQTLLRNIERVIGRRGETVVHPAFLDLRWFASEWNVPVVVYGPGDGGADTGFRRKVYSEPDEYVLIDDLVNATKVLALSIPDLITGVVPK